MATNDVYQAAFAVFAEREGLPLESQPVFRVADLEHAFYMGMARGTTEGTAQASETIIGLAKHNKALAARIAELESFGLQGESEVVKTLLNRIAKLEQVRIVPKDACIIVHGHGGSGGKGSRP